MKYIIHIIILILGLTLAWQSIVYIFQLPSYILPSPVLVIKSIYTHFALLISETKITMIETLIGLTAGVLLGSITALFMSMFKPVKFWVLPILLISQALPTFAIAPLLVIWFGFGLASKIVTTIIMLFFPVATALYDGLSRTPEHWLELAKTMRASTFKTFLHIRLPAALPSFASGLRIATAIAPIGAVVGEWVGASKGLGYLMLNSNARMQIDLMFAALFFIILFSLTLYFVVDIVLKKIIFWQGTIV